MGPAVLTFLISVRDPENRHGAALGASGVCGVTREGSWSKEQGYRALAVTVAATPAQPLQRPGDGHSGAWREESCRNRKYQKTTHVIQMR